MENCRFKVTYLHHLMATAFVRIEDDYILYANDDEMFVIMFAKGFCAARDERFFIE